MIPKIIHYVWLGDSEKPESVKSNIANWRVKLPDYEFVEWNNDTISAVADKSVYVREACEEKAWAFVSDYIRLWALWTQGGIYLDTDVEVLQSFDPLLHYESFVGKEASETICTAVIGAQKGCQWLQDSLIKYNDRHFILDGKLDKMPNSKYLFQVINQYKSVTILPEDFFSPIHFGTKRKNVTASTYTIHHYSGTWKTKGEKFKDRILIMLNVIVGEKRIGRLRETIGI